MKELKIKLLPLVLIICFLSSCKVYLDVEKLKPKVSEELRAGDFVVSSLNKLVEGDRIIFRTIDGEKHNLFYKQTIGDKMIGTSINSGFKGNEETKNLEFAVADIEKLWVKRVSAAATVPIVLIGSLGIAFGILIIALAIDPITF